MNAQDLPPQTNQAADWFAWESRESARLANLELALIPSWPRWSAWAAVLLRLRPRKFHKRTPPTDWPAAIERMGDAIRKQEFRALGSWSSWRESAAKALQKQAASAAAIRRRG